VPTGSLPSINHAFRSVQIARVSLGLRDTVGNIDAFAFGLHDRDGREPDEQRVVRIGARY